jgi:hypothetical protein
MAQEATAAFVENVAVSRAGSGRGTVTSSPGGIACGKVCTHGYAYGTPVTLKAKAARGSTFAGWSGACNGTRGCALTTDDDLAVKATFVLRPCVVPKVVGKTLKAAKTALKKSFCSVGKVRTAASPRVKKGHVISQRPRPHKKLEQHARVNLVLSKG